MNCAAVGDTALLTAGHGRLTADEFVALLDGAAVDTVVDIRRFPGSRAHPHLSGEAMSTWLPAARIDYRWEERLGGRRRLPADAPREDPWWQVEQFAAYAAHTRTDAFGTALNDVLALGGRRRVLVMCSESVWWRCHRRLVADVAVLGRGATVDHLMHDGRLTPHPVSAGARRRDDGQLVWDVVS